MTTNALRGILRSVDRWSAIAEEIAPNKRLLEQQPLNYRRVLYYNIQRWLERHLGELIRLVESAERHGWLQIWNDSFLFRRGEILGVVAPCQLLPGHFAGFYFANEDTPSWCGVVLENRVDAQLMVQKFATVPIADNDALLGVKRLALECDTQRFMPEEALEERCA